MTSKSATHPFLTMAARVFCRFGTLRYLPHCSDGTKRLIRASQPTKNKIQERQFFCRPSSLFVPQIMLAKTTQTGRGSLSRIGKKARPISGIEDDVFRCCRNCPLLNRRSLSGGKVLQACWLPVDIDAQTGGWTVSTGHCCWFWTLLWTLCRYKSRPTVAVKEHHRCRRRELTVDVISLDVAAGKRGPTIKQWRLESRSRPDCVPLASLRLPQGCCCQTQGPSALILQFPSWKYRFHSFNCLRINVFIA